MGLAKGTTKSGGQKHDLDKFYTKPEIALACIQRLDISQYDLIIEPSAGAGAFSNQIEGSIAYDLEPENSNVTKQDWFSYSQPRNSKKRTLVIGNPPFGQQNSLAVKFINHAASFADTIAFILPLSFQKESVQDKLNLNYTLSQEWVVPKNSFTLENESINVPAVFQIWNYTPNTPRIVAAIPSFKGFNFVKKVASPDLYIQRVGGKAGAVGTHTANRSEASNYFIKVDTDIISVPDFITVIEALVHGSRDFTVGPRSISKRELLNEILAQAPQLKA
jgi:predicted RNA methylase